jgi:WD40 repeat protein
VKLWDLQGDKVMDIGVHDAPVKDVFFIPAMNNCVVSAGWDGMIKFWDTRDNKPILQ